MTNVAAYLANAEREAVTQALLAIPGWLERVQHNQSTPSAQYRNWRTLCFRNDSEWRSRCVD